MNKHPGEKFSSIFCSFVPCFTKVSIFLNSQASIYGKFWNFWKFNNCPVFNKGFLGKKCWKIIRMSWTSIRNTRVPTQKSDIIYGRPLAQLLTPKIQLCLIVIVNLIRFPTRLLEVFLSIFWKHNFYLIVHQKLSSVENLCL